MPFNAAQLAVSANTAIEYFLKNEPIDQVNFERPWLKTLMDGKQNAPGANLYVEQIYISNDSNYQNYFGAQQVTYNERDGIRQARYNYYNFHDGFGIDEDRLAANGITITDAGDSVVTQAETFQLTNLLKTGFHQLREGVHDGLHEELLRDGLYDANACPGLDALVSTTPTVGIVGGLNAATQTYWRNNASLNIAATPGTLTEQMEIQWRACTRFGGSAPTHIMASGAFIDAYRRDAKSEVDRRIQVSGRGGTNLDASVSGVFFKGIPIVWNPTLDILDAKFGAPPVRWDRRCYFLNMKHLKLRPVTGQWMINRAPQRVHDRYVHYRALTAKYRLTMNKRNCHAVLSVA
ncbi:phage major capsid protein [Ralstonia sp.]|uniref:phage major capsid protein n=1 Tax=Ralstonia sp. TaxID=54061 RepID=UPI00257FED44|nr:phage major capsid protein [Ralstonia sp.]MBA4279304.1 phage major capsid protein [Ralstonia sp.]